MRYRNLIIFGVTAATSFGAILVFVRGTLKKRLIIGLAALAILGCLSIFLRGPLKEVIMQVPALRPLLGKKTIEDQIQTYGEVTRTRLSAMFKERGFAYPPAKLAMLAFKDKRILEVYTAQDDGNFQHLHTYPILGASGKLGIGNHAALAAALAAILTNPARHAAMRTAARTAITDHYTLTNTATACRTLYHSLANRR